MLENYPNDVLSVTEVQNILKIGRNSTYQLLKTGHISSRRLKKKYIIPKSAIIKYLEGIEKADK